MTTVYIGIGSNIGDKVANCQRAIELIGEKMVIRKVSSLYETKPWGYSEQDDFVNSVIEATTSLGTGELLPLIQTIERDVGRDGVATRRWGPRVIDLDILFYGMMVLDENRLIIPHPHIAQRAFVLVPLAEIAPALLHPRLNKTPLEMLSELGDKSGVQRLDMSFAVGLQ
ncbi:MAG: 2-amino-4-hydroxy-6-hydroxymethyldihydropteridine diphosphokinase [Deltaproteobacteria bacterium]|nr:2-amino-4-hydroxy-6-hydroxymethyldihydropteridine diphosphokinase [Deltaproteobacteria bacterium]